MGGDERRQHYRVEDEISFDYCVVNAKDAFNEAAITKRLLGENGLRYQEIMDYFKPIDNQLSELEFMMSKDNQPLLHYLKLINNKVDYLTSALLLNEHSNSSRVDLSLNGLSFKTNEYIPEQSHLKIRINTKPQCIPIVLDAKVIYCKLQADERYRIATTFLDVNQKQEHLLNQHILSVQTQQKLD